MDAVGVEERTAGSVDATTTPGATGTTTGWRSEAERVTRVAAGGILAGLVSGFLVGGVGGRLAMRLVAVQTDDHFQGVTTDDGATTGEITLGGTVALIAFVTLVGVLGGLVYVVLRPLLPAGRRARAATWALVTGTIGGSLVVHRDGVDYTILGSPATSAAVFVGLLALYGVVTALVAERLLAPDGRARTGSLRALLPSFLLLLPGLTILPVLAAGGAVVGVRTLGWHRAVPGAAVQVVGRVAMAVVVGLVAVSLAGTIVDVV